MDGETARQIVSTAPLSVLSLFSYEGCFLHGPKNDEVLKAGPSPFLFSSRRVAEAKKSACW